MADVYIRTVFPVTSERIQELQDKKASAPALQSLSASLNDKARMKLELSKGPGPLPVIHYQGILNTEPKRQRSEKALEDMDRIGLIYEALTLEENPALVDSLKALILSWVETYIPTGDPINENKLTPLLCAYLSFKTHFSESEQQTVENWVKELVKAHEEKTDIPQNNWLAKRLLIYAYASLILDQPEYAKKSTEGFKTLVDTMLYADGSSHEIEQRDSLSYHVGLLRPMLLIAIIAKSYPESFGTEDLYNYKSEQGGSVAQSVRFLLPYASGDEIFLQWTNSKVGLDHERAKAGIPAYQPGKPFDPQKALPAFILASSFTVQLEEIIDELLPESEHKLTFEWLRVACQQVRDTD